MKTIAVFDLMKGRLVAARGGQRSTYQPLSTLHRLPEKSPIHWANVLRSRLGIQQIYLADLDAMDSAVGAQGVAIAQQLLAIGFEVWLDMGIVDLAIEPSESAEGEVDGADEQSRISELSSLLDHQKFHLVVPTEGVGIESASALLQRWPRQWRRRTTLSLDVFGTETQGGPEPKSLALRWFRTENEVDVRGLVQELCDLSSFDVQNAILLNLSNVGSGRNTTAGLLHRLRNAMPHWTWITGGGVSNAEDLRRLETAGCDWVLIGSWIWKQLEAIYAQDYFAGQADQ